MNSDERRRPLRPSSSPSVSRSPSVIHVWAQAHQRTCTRTYMCGHKRTNAHATRIHTSTCTRTYTRVHAHAHTHEYMHTHIHTSTCTHAYTQVHAHAHTCVGTSAPTHMHTHKRTNAHAHAHTCVGTSAPTHMHTHKRACARIHTLVQALAGLNAHRGWCGEG